MTVYPTQPEHIIIDDSAGSTHHQIYDAYVHQLTGVLAERDALQQIVHELTAQRSAIIGERDALLLANAALREQVAGLASERNALLKRLKMQETP